MDVALASGSLPVTLAEGAITVSAGQTRLSNTTVRAANADLAVSGILNLADGALDARLILFGTAGPDAPSNTRPEVMISLKGPLEAPRRTIDVAALASWLALRAVEQQSKKLDVLEGREPPPSPPKSEAAPAAPASPAGALPEAASSAASATPTPRARPTVFGSPSARRARPTVFGNSSANGQSNGGPRAKPLAAPAAGQLAPLPPPVDIRPAPGARTRAPNGAGQGAVRLPQPPPPKPLAITPPLRTFSVN